MSNTGTRISFSHEQQTSATKLVIGLLKANKETPKRELLKKYFFQIQEKAGLNIPESKWENVAKWLIPNINLVFCEITENIELQKAITKLKKDLEVLNAQLEIKNIELNELKKEKKNECKKMKIYIAGLLPKQQQILLQNEELTSKCIFKFVSSEQHNNTQFEHAMANSDYLLLMTDFINRNTIVKRFKNKLINVNGGITTLEDTITKLLNKK